MNRPRLIRGLRIAWSVWWGIVCVLLVVLWVRSYWRCDTVSVDEGGGLLGLSSYSGVFSLVAYEWNGSMTRNWTYDSTNPEDDPFSDSGPPSFAQGLTIFDFDYFKEDAGIWLTIAVPTWTPIVVAALITAAPWIPWRRFSLRTLLIATTLLAVVLGLVVWSSQ